jgi:hypothetical protein
MSFPRGGENAGLAETLRRVVGGEVRFDHHRGDRRVLPAADRARDGATCPASAGNRPAGTADPEHGRLIMACAVEDAGEEGCVTALMWRRPGRVQMSGGCDVDRLV